MKMYNVICDGAVTHQFSEAARALSKAYRLAETHTFRNVRVEEVATLLRLEDFTAELGWWNAPETEPEEEERLQPLTMDDWENGL